MNTSLVSGNLLNITAEQLGTAKATTISRASEWTSAMSSFAQGQHEAEDSCSSAWIMIGTIIICLAIMMAVVTATATSMA